MPLNVFASVFLQVLAFVISAENQLKSWKSNENHVKKPAENQMKISWNITHAKFKQHQFKNTARGGSGSKIANLEITLFMDGPRWPLLSGWIFCQLEEAAVDGANDKCILRSVGISENLEGGGICDQSCDDLRQSSNKVKAYTNW